jgi:hypothetical protein
MAAVSRACGGDRELSHELLLQWMSERGSGSWDEFRDAYRWAVPDARAGAAHRFMRALATLAHVETDWDAGAWTAAPTVVTLLPSAGGHGLLAGARTGRLRAVLADGLDEAPHVFAFFREQEDAPDVCFIACDSEADLIELAAQLDVPFEHSVADRLASLLPPIDAMLAERLSTPGVPDLGVDRLDVQADRWRPVESDREPGLYRYEYRGRELRWIDEEGRPHRVDLALGAYCELRRLARSDVLSWMELHVNGTLSVPLSAPLPVLQARAATMCSGVAPQRYAGVLRYENVPLRIAEAIAASLDQQLREY